MNTARLGDAAEMEAAAYFMRQGRITSFPHSTAPYDFIVDYGDWGFKRVEVKSTTRKAHVKRGCKEWGWVTIVDTRKSFDLLYVHTPDVHYLIPRFALGAQRSGGITVPAAEDYPTDSKWAEFRVQPCGPDARRDNGCQSPDRRACQYMG